MYEAFFGFHEKPFNLTPDPRFVFLSARHTEAFAHLAYGHQERGGFIVITGEVGAGKTTLARYFLEHLGAESATAVVLYPSLSAHELLRTILDDLHVRPLADSPRDLVEALHNFLLDARRRGRTVVLLIDEAQALPAEALEQIRLLTNLETDTEKLIQIVLMGQPELNDLLARHELRQLAQRVTARYHIGALDRAETAAYVRHRLDVASGGPAAVRFSSAAMSEVFSFSRGIPRLVNLVCDRALLAAYVEGSHEVGRGMVRQAAHELRGPQPRPALPFWVAAAGVAAAALAILWPRTASSPSLPPSPSPAVEARPAHGVRSLEELHSALAGVPPDQALRRAVDRLRVAWGAARVEEASLRLEAPQLRALDLPAALELALPDRSTRHAALLGLDGERATLAAAGDTFRVRWAEVTSAWTGRAVVLWKDFESLALAPDPAWAERWTRLQLRALGYSGEGDALGPSLARFQRDAGLSSDGVLGPRTLMALYSRADYPRPRLGGSPP